MALSFSEQVIKARSLAASGQFRLFVGLCEELLADASASPDSLAEVGALYAEFGFASRAQHCYEQLLALRPGDLGTQANLATLLREMAEHAPSRRLYAQLQRHLPDHPVIRRNVLTGLEYDPLATDAERLNHARAWGQWAIARAGGPRPRPALRPLDHRLLRLGYISADLCQHTVGLFVKDVLKAHDPNRVQVFAYSTGQVKDWVTDEIRAACTLRDVTALEDEALAGQIRSDGIDVLIDLSGHTAGSRLTAFAYRPAPVMVSWLGYFATVRHKRTPTLFNIKSVMR